MSFVLLILVIVALAAVVAIASYNRMVALRQNCNQAVNDVDVQLRQRHELVPNLVATVKGYAAHEQSTLDSVIAARNQAVSAPSSASEQQLSGAIKGLLALGEAYPDLKANTNFQALQGELADVEDKLAAARRTLNSASADYNTAIAAFPGVMFASAFGFKPFDVSHIAADERAAVTAAPTVQF
ncbi:MAG: LemA family protein [Sphingomonadales bacterium]|nr:LemA family protein [Sphingomonadales bacterium]